MKKGAIFDQDGLMFDTETIFRKAWHMAAEEYHTEIKPGYFEAMCGSSGDYMLEIIGKYVEGVDPAEYRERAFAISYAIQDEYLPEKKGLKEILTYFKEHGVKMAVASSSRKERVMKNLRKSGVDSCFDAVISGDEVKNGKPAPDIFLLAAEKLGLPAEDCYVFEDSHNGVRSGHAAGCCTVMIPDLIPPNEEIKSRCDACCSDFTEVIQLLKEGKL